MGRLVEAFAGWIKKVAEAYRRRLGLSFDDAHQETCIAFMKCIRTHAPERGANFRTYLANKVPFLLLELDRGKTITIGRQALARMLRKGGGFSVSSIDEFREQHGMPPAVFAPEPPADHPHAWAVADSMERLPENYRKVITRYYGFDGEPRPMHVVGREIGVSEPRVSFIHAEALGLLRERISRKLSTSP